MKQIEVDTYHGLGQADCCATCVHSEGWMDNMLCNLHGIETRPYWVCETFSHNEFMKKVEAVKVKGEIDFGTLYAEALELSTIGGTNKEGDISLYDWMKGSGGCAGMTAQEIADEWDALNEWDLLIDDTEDAEYD